MWTYPHVNNSPSWFQPVLVIAFLGMMAFGLKGISYIGAQKWLAAGACFGALAIIAVVLIIIVRRF